MCIAFAVAHDPAERSLGPFVEETLKPRGEHGDFGWNHGCHVFFALGLETLNDGSEFRSQLFHADRLVLFENAIVDLVADLLALGFRAMRRSPAHSVQYRMNVALRNTGFFSNGFC
jgi:hypothetical protein